MRRNYLDTSVVAKLNILNKRSKANDNTGSFMSSHQRKLGSQRPVAIDCMEIGVADPGVLDVDENLIWAGFLNWNFLVDDS